MEPLSISTGIIGFITFLHGISNFMGKIITAQKDEEEAVKQFRRHIRHLESTLSEVQGYKEDLETAAPGNQSVDCSDLEACLVECRGKLQKFVDKIQNPHFKRKALLNRLTWPIRQERSKKILDLVNQYKSTLQLELTVKQGRAIHGMALKIQTQAAVGQDTAQRDKIVERFDIVDVNATFNRARDKSYPGTGTWFLESNEFARFKNKSGKHLWLQGMPGAGKTVLSSSIIVALGDYVKDQPTYALAYFFFSYRAEDKQNTYNMLSSIVGQLCRNVRIILENVIKKLACNMARLPISVLLDLISSLIQSFSRVYIVLDAPDEVKNEERCSFIGILQNIIGSSTQLNVNLLMTSRREDWLIRGLIRLPLQQMTLTTAVVDMDIYLYVYQIFSQAATLWQWNSDLCRMTEKIVETLTKQAKGMFRWVDCQVENLKTCRRPCDVEDTLNSLPQDLDETYKRILLSIERRYQVYAARLLAWITFSQQELCIAVLGEAIIFEPDTSELDPKKRFKDPSDIIDICRNLIGAPTLSSCRCFHSNKKPHYINISHKTLSLSHYSVKEYLLSERFKNDKELAVYSSLFDKGSSYLMNVWIQYWQMVTLRSSFDLGEREIYFPLLKHCILALTRYVCGLENHLSRTQWAQQLAHLACDNAILLKDVFKDYTLPLYPPIWCPVSLFVYHGLYDGIKICKLRGYNAHSIVWYHDRPITVLALALRMHLVYDQAPQPDLAILFENGATDIIDDELGKYSPALTFALQHALFCRGPCLADHIPTVALLLQHGSLIHSPYYNGGSLFTYLKRLMTHSSQQVLQNKSIIMEVLQLITTAPSYHPPGFDPIFEASDGFIHSFVGEAIEYHAAYGNLYALRSLLSKGAQITKPVRHPNTMTTLLKFPISPLSFKRVCCEYYFSFNVFCAMPSLPFDSEKIDFSRHMWMDKISILLAHGGDINALDCIVGRETNEILYLEYCTALDLVQFLHVWYQVHWEKQKWVSEEISSCHSNELEVNLLTYLDLVSSVLKDHGARILSRESVPERRWRISSEWADNSSDMSYFTQYETWNMLGSGSSNNLNWNDWLDSESEGGDVVRGTHTSKVPKFPKPFRSSDTYYENLCKRAARS